MKVILFAILTISMRLMCSFNQCNQSDSYNKVEIASEFLKIGCQKDSVKILQDSLKVIVYKKINADPKTFVEIEIRNLYVELLSESEGRFGISPDIYDWIAKMDRKLSKDGLLTIDSTDLVVKVYKINTQLWMSSFRMEGEPENTIVIEKDGKLVLNSKIIKGRGKKLNKVQSHKLLSMISLPSNFEWGWCGSAIPEAGIVFERNKEIVFALDVRCGNQLVSHPEDVRMKSGALVNEADLQNILNEIGVDFK